MNKDRVVLDKYALEEFYLIQVKNYLKQHLLEELKN